MNTLEGIIHHIDSSQSTSLVEVLVDGDSFFAVLLETPETTSQLKKGTDVTLLFKETEVMIGKDVASSLSVLNHSTAVVNQIRKGTVLTEVELTYKNHVIVGIIPSKAVERLNVREGENVSWFIKVNEITLQWGV